ncbi:MAG: hypothetical protein ACYSWO_27750 [Planctomycetota bacterium]|jgi:hypothetical protein
MKLVKGRCGFDCVAASLAMVCEADLDYIMLALFSDLEKPFSGLWSHIPKIPDMNAVCDWMWGDRKIALVPFEYNPQSTPHKDCPPVPVWPRSLRCRGDADNAWARALAYGPGLLEGTTGTLGHMVAWSGDAIYDPRGFIYSINIAVEKFEFSPRRFWLAVPTRK